MNSRARSLPLRAPLLLSLTLGCSGGATATATETATDTATTAATTAGSTTGPDIELGECDPPTGDLLFPLEVGRSWGYLASCNCDWDGDTTVRTVTGTQEIGGREAFALVNYFGGASVTTYLSQTGQSVDRWDSLAEVWEPIINEPIEEGYEWGEFPISHWEAVESIETPAGTFSDCWTVISCYNGACVDRVTYCPGYGPVRDLSLESSYTLNGCG